MPITAASAVDPLSVKKLSYDIKKLGLRVGVATLEFKGHTERNGKMYNLIIFEAKGFKFFDHEEIYMDIATSYPSIVVRKVDFFGKKEDITERYLQKEGKVIISKVNGKQHSKLELNVQGPIDNIYCFIYRLKSLRSEQLKSDYNVHLPTKDVDFHLSKERSLKHKSKLTEAIIFESTNKKYKIWFSADERFTPLKIDGATGFGHSSMILQ